MAFLQLLPIILSYLLMTAHLFRGQHYVLVVLAVFMPLLLFIPRRWVARVIQLGLAISAAEWLRTIAMLTMERMASGQPYLRMGLILGAVVIFTTGSAFSFYWAGMRGLYKLKQRGKEQNIGH